MSPTYLVASKEVVKEREKPRWTKRKNVPEVTKSWHNYMVKKVVQDFQASSLQVLETPFDEKVVANIPSAHYEFPTGYNQDFAAERFRIPEALFDPSMVNTRQMFVTQSYVCKF